MAWVLPGWGGGLELKEASLPEGALEEASSLAEELVGDFFGLTSRDWRFLQYVLFLEKELVFAEEALASLFLFETQALLPGKRRRFYGLFLAEDKILSLGLRGPSLEALLLYIFTHELVHMVRFLKFSASFWMPYEGRFKEEREVHLLCRKILRRVPGKELQDIIYQFDQIYS